MVGDLGASVNKVAPWATDCLHLNFQAQVNVFRLSEKEGGPINGYTADVTVRCCDCNLPFRFRGFGFGSSPNEPRLSIDGTVLRAPLEPAYVTEIAGHPLTAGNA
jgi:hypothetical protein